MLGDLPLLHAPPGALGWPFYRLLQTPLVLQTYFKQREQGHISTNALKAQRNSSTVEIPAGG